MIIPPHNFTPISNADGLATNEMQGWMQDVSDLLTIATGTGSPEGVFFAQQLKNYLDTATGELWKKTTEATLSTGWVKIG